MQELDQLRALANPELAERNAARHKTGRQTLGLTPAQIETAVAGWRDNLDIDGRVALARVLLRARPILLLDEPFAALGPALKAEMLSLLNDIADGTEATVLMVTHDPQDARVFSPQTILVEDGRAHAPRDTGPLLDNPPPGLRAYLG